MFYISCITFQTVTVLQQFCLMNMDFSNVFDFVKSFVRVVKLFGG